MSRENMHCIFFDTNEGSHGLGYWLNLPASLRDLALLGDEVRDGLKVIIMMPGELKMEAVLEYDHQHGHWNAVPVPGTIEYLDGSA